MKKHRIAGLALALGLLMISPAAASEGTPEVVLGDVQVTIQPAEHQVEATQITVSSSGPVVTDAQRRILEKYYQILPELKKLTLQTAGESSIEGAWEFHFYQTPPQGNSPVWAANAQLIVAANTGELEILRISHPQWATEELPPAELAKQQATQFIKQVMGDQADLYRVDPSLGYGGSSSSDSEGNELHWSTASVRFDPVINGIPVLYNELQVDVDAAGRITGFYRHQTALRDASSFPDPAKAISQPAAAAIMNQLIQMKLQYVQHQPLQYPPVWSNKPRETRPVLMYIPKFESALDALTGKPAWGEEYLNSQGERVRLTGAGKQLFAQTQEEAAKILTEEFNVDMSKLEFERLFERENVLRGDQKYKHYLWRTADDAEAGMNRKYVQLHTVAATGEIWRFSVQEDVTVDQEARVSPKLLRQKAVQLVEKYLPAGATEMELVTFDFAAVPDWVDKQQLKKEELPQPTTSFMFSPLHQGIPVSDGAYAVSMNNITGEVTEYAKGGLATDVTLPDSRGVATAEVAKAEYLKNHPLQLIYRWPEWFRQRAANPELVYMLNSDIGWGYIDAFTGKTVMIQNGSM